MIPDNLRLRTMLERMCSKKIQSVLNVPVEFVDSWRYQFGFGNVHCGSNAKRTPMSNWWQKLPNLPQNNPKQNIQK